MAPQAPRAVRAPVTFKKQKDHHSGLCDLQSPISNLQSPASTHLRPDPVRSPISISNLHSPASYFAGSSSDLRSSSPRSPISNLNSEGRGRGRARTFKEMRYGFIHTAHLRSPISNLPFDPCRRQLRSPISNLDLQSPPQWWMPGARIYDLCSPSPISTFDPGNCQHDPQSVISIFHLQPSPTVW